VIKKLFSPFTLSPLILGLGAAAFFWFAKQQKPMAEFLAVAGGLGALGSFITMLLAGGKTVSPAAARRRDEMVSGLGDLLDMSRFAATTESDRLAVPAQPERA
jgi:hypothetical protein